MMPDPEPQVTNFLDSVKYRTPFALNESNGFRSCTIINLGKDCTTTRSDLTVRSSKLNYLLTIAEAKLFNQPTYAMVLGLFKKHDMKKYYTYFDCSLL
jgi:hypothetical protein